VNAVVKASADRGIRGWIPWCRYRRVAPLHSLATFGLAKQPSHQENPMLQLNPPIPLNTPKGEGFAHLVIDYGPESDLYWTVLITETGEIWTYANKYVRASK
jgi:hypothetical protein